jgi:hypothetical protein
MGVRRRFGAVARVGSRLAEAGDRQQQKGGRDDRRDDSNPVHVQLSNLVKGCRSPASSKGHFQRCGTSPGRSASVAAKRVDEPGIRVTAAVRRPWPDPREPAGNPERRCVATRRVSQRSGSTAAWLSLQGAICAAARRSERSRIRTVPAATAGGSSTLRGSTPSAPPASARNRSTRAGGPGGRMGSSHPRFDTLRVDGSTPDPRLHDSGRLTAVASADRAAG